MRRVPRLEGAPQKLQHIQHDSAHCKGPEQGPEGIAAEQGLILEKDTHGVSAQLIDIWLKICMRIAVK